VTSGFCPANFSKPEAYKNESNLNLSLCASCVKAYQ